MATKTTPIIGTVTPAATLPAAYEGELRDLARELRVNLSFVSDRLEAIIARYSGLRPMRSDKRTP